MRGWLIPPPKESTKSSEDFVNEREAKVRGLIKNGYLKSPRIESALLKVPREIFIPDPYRDYAYQEIPLPLPGERATISCPHSYPLFYEPLGLDKGHRFLEIGSGSGYGAAIAREVVGREGLVVSVEIDPVTFEFAKRNIERAGYDDILVVNGDGGLGYPDMSPYDRIAITAACREIPPPLIDQLKTWGRLITPIHKGPNQKLVLIEKEVDGIESYTICDVLYVSLRGEYGV
ncbi:MAG: protein-L-isoaspartate O-methyltransferase [Anaerolineales bacterium]|nr:protein-L-isoaspartate O-methyltransferase [Anaerolineales bacterium]